MTTDSDPPRVQFTKSSDRPFMEGTVRGKHEVLVDERDQGPPVGSGEDQYPTPVDYMISSLVSCQVAVLTQCLAKSRVETFNIEAEAEVTDEFVEDVPEEMPTHTGTRVQHLDVMIHVEVPPEFESRAERCLDVYDQGCIVGQSFQAGINYTPKTSLTVTY